MTISQSGGLRASAAIVLAAFAGAAAADTERHGDYIVVHTIDGSKEEAAATLRDAVDDHADWVMITEFTMLGGEVLAQRICYLPIVPSVLEAGMHTMAIMPCGNLAFYEEDGQTRLTRLDGAWLEALYDGDLIVAASEQMAPAFDELIEDVFGAASS